MRLTSGIVELSARSASAPVAAPVSQRTAPPLRTTLGVITLSGLFWCVWFNTTTGEPLTLFAQKLGASNFQFGVLTALPFLASLMAVPGSLLIERTGRRKGIFLCTLYTQRLLWVPIAIVPVWMWGRSGGGQGAASAALAAFLALMLAMYAVGSIGGPAWLGWMADVVPSRLNGKYFSRRRQWGICAAIPAAAFMGWFLDHGSAEPWGRTVLGWCALFFLVAAVCGVADIHMYQYVPARDRATEPRIQWAQTFCPPLRDRPFLAASGFIGMLTFALTFLGQFATLYLLDRIGMRNMSVQMALVVAPMIGQLLTLGAWGRAADRAGKRPLLILASAGLVPVGIAWCFVTPATVWLAYVLSGLGAALWTGVEVVNMNLVLERSVALRGASGYAAVNTVIVNVAGCLGGLAAGGLAQTLSSWHWQPLPGVKVFTFFDALFIAGGVLRLLAVWAMVPFLHEPTARPVRDVLRFMAGYFAELILPTGRRQRLAIRTTPARTPQVVPPTPALIEFSENERAPKRAA